MKIHVIAYLIKIFREEIFEISANLRYHNKHNFPRHLPLLLL